VSCMVMSSLNDHVTPSAYPRKTRKRLNKKGSNKGWVWVGALLVILVGAFGVWFYQANWAPKPGPVTVKFGYIPIADAAPLFVAIEEKLFEKHGILPEVTSIRGGALILEGLGAGSLNVGFSNTLSFMLARDAGLEFVSLGGVATNDAQHVEGAILVRDDSPIATVADLVGRTIAINASRNIVELSVRQLLKKNGVSPDEVRFVEIAFPQMEPTLKSGQVDAIPVAEPFWSFAVKNGGVRKIADYFGDVYDEIEIASWFATKQWIEQNTTAARNVRDALIEAVTFLSNPANEARVREIIGKYTEIDSAIANKMGLPAFKSQLTINGLGVILNGMIEEGFVDHKIPLESLFFQP